MNNPGCAHEAIDILLSEGGDAIGNESFEGRTERLAFCQDRAP